MPGFWRGALLGFCGLLVGIQAIRPARTNLAVKPSHTLEAIVPVPPEVESILQRACYDCHSDQTRWPWYSNVAPVSWFVIDHVDGGRRHANFSAWLRRDTKDPAQYTRERFEAICKQVRFVRCLYGRICLCTATRVSHRAISRRSAGGPGKICNPVIRNFRGRGTAVKIPRLGPNN